MRSFLSFLTAGLFAAMLIISTGCESAEATSEDAGSGVIPPSSSSGGSSGSKAEALTLSPASATVEFGSGANTVSAGKQNISVVNPDGMATYTWSAPRIGTLDKTSGTSVLYTVSWNQNDDGEKVAITCTRSGGLFEDASATCTITLKYVSN